MTHDFGCCGRKKFPKRNLNFSFTHSLNQTTQTPRKLMSAAVHAGYCESHKPQSYLKRGKRSPQRKKQQHQQTTSSLGKPKHTHPPTQKTNTQKELLLPKTKSTNLAALKEDELSHFRKNIDKIIECKPIDATQAPKTKEEEEIFRMNEELDAAIKASNLLFPAFADLDLQKFGLVDDDSL